jgi:hypothetical protein
VVLLATRQYEPRRRKRNGAGAKQRNPGVRRTGRRKAGTILVRAGTECEIMPGEINVHFHTNGWNESPTCAWESRGWIDLAGKVTVAGKQYFARQAAILLKFAKATTDPKVAAGLVEKAAELRSQVDEAPDKSPQAPDVESPL